MRAYKILKFDSGEKWLGTIFETPYVAWRTDTQKQKKIYIYIYIYAVELKAGPICAILVLKAGPNFLFFCVFLFLKISFSLQKEENLSKKEKETKNDPFLALTTGPILLRNILGPVFNASLDQF